MPLEEIELDLSTADLPSAASELIAESDRRIDDFFASGENKRFPKYIPGDPELAYRALKFVTEADLPLGRNFVEWGSAFGVVTGLASLLGYQAYGIELESTLVEQAEALAEKMNLEAEFLCASYVPDGLDSYSGMGGEYLLEEEVMASRDPDLVSEFIYEGMDFEIAEVDVFFVYPWPLEQEFVQQLFEAVAVEGAILITYHKMGEIYAYRKVGDEPM